MAGEAPRPRVTPGLVGHETVEPGHQQVQRVVGHLRVLHRDERLDVLPAVRHGAAPLDLGQGLVVLELAAVVAPVVVVLPRTHDSTGRAGPGRRRRRVTVGCGKVVTAGNGASQTAP